MNITSATLEGGRYLKFWAHPAYKEARIVVTDNDGLEIINSPIEIVALAQQGNISDDSPFRQIEVDILTLPAMRKFDYKKNNITARVAPIADDGKVGLFATAEKVEKVESQENGVKKRRISWWGFGAILLVIVIIIGSIASILKDQSWARIKELEKQLAAATNASASAPGRIITTPVAIVNDDPKSSETTKEPIGGNKIDRKDSPPKEGEPVVSRTDDCDEAEKAQKKVTVLSWPFTVNPEIRKDILKDKCVYDPTVSVADICLKIPPGADYVYTYPYGWDVEVKRKPAKVHSAYNLGTTHNTHWVLPENYESGNIQSVRLMNSDSEKHIVCITLTRDRSIVIPRKPVVSENKKSQQAGDVWPALESSMSIDLFEKTPFDPNRECYRFPITVPPGANYRIKYPGNKFRVGYTGNFRDLECKFNVGTHDNPQWKPVKEAEEDAKKGNVRAIWMWNKGSYPAAIEVYVVKPGYEHLIPSR